MLARLASQRLLEIRQAFRQSNQVFPLLSSSFSLQFLLIQTSLDLTSIPFCSVQQAYRSFSTALNYVSYSPPTNKYMTFNFILQCKISPNQKKKQLIEWIWCDLFLCSTLIAQITIPTFLGNFLRLTKKRLAQIQFLEIRVADYHFPIIVD